jgi:hypothetical protein
MAKTAIALIKATKTWIENEKKRGGLIEAWGYTEGTGGVGIVESDSNDAVYTKLMENPFSPFMEYCVTPLTDMNLQLKTAEEFYKKMAEAMS